MSPTSPRQINIDPHLPVPSRSHAVNLSPNALSPSRAIGPHHVPHPGHPHRGNSNHGRSYRDEEGARERQMQQDIESAMSMCKWVLALFAASLREAWFQILSWRLLFQAWLSNANIQQLRVIFDSHHLPFPI